MGEKQAKVLTLVFTDLADSTALKSSRGDDVVDDLLTRHCDHVTRLTEECAGRVIDWAGDGCFLTFETSSAGVLFPLQLRKAHSGVMIAKASQTGPIRFETPVSYFENIELDLRNYQLRDVGLDGRLLMTRDDTDHTEVILVENWFEELKRLAPVPGSN